MISYPIDFNKPIQVIAEWPQDQVIGLRGYAKDIQTKEKGKYGAMECFAVMHYKDIPTLSKTDKHWIRLARKHGDKDCEREVYVRAIAALQNKNKAKNE